MGDFDKLPDSLRTDQPFFHPAVANERSLLVFVPGFRKRVLHYDSLLSRLFKENCEPFSTCDLLPYAYNNKWCSCTKPQTAADGLREVIRNHLQRYSERRYDRVYLVAHSFGGLIAREAVLDALNDNDGWLSKLKLGRLILFASTNRGFTIEHCPLQLRLLVSLVSFLRLPLLGLQALRGSVWLNNLRLGWVRLKQKGLEPPDTVQIRGKLDEIVEPDDSLDLYRYSNTLEIELKGFNHSSFVDPTGDAYEAIRNAFTKSLAQPARQAERANATQLIFLLHGIRDYAEWQESLEYSLRQQAGAEQSVIVSVRYGYFSALQFVLTGQRERTARAFADRYIQELAKYPGELTIHAVAHSNGTYALTRAIRQYDEMTFDNVYLVGSVLPKKFRWEELANQVKLIRNDCASFDWPVAVLCWFVRWLPWNWGKIGTAGVDGFSYLNKFPKKGGNVQFIEGEHGVGLRVTNATEIIRFLLANGLDRQHLARQKIWRLRGLRLLLMLVLAFVVSIYWLLLWPGCLPGLQEYKPLLVGLFTLILIVILMSV